MARVRYRVSFTVEVDLDSDFVSAEGVREQLEDSDTLEAIEGAVRDAITVEPEVEVRDAYGIGVLNLDAGDEDAGA